MNIFDLQATISLNAAAFTSGVEEAQTTFNNLGNTISPGAVAIGNVVGNMATKAAGDLVDFGKSVIDTGVNFDTSMSNVKAISGATAEEFDALRAKAQEMGASTKFTATEAADAFSYMAMAGWKAEDMISGVEGIMNLAAASGEDLATTSDIVTDSLTAFGLSAADSGHFADVLAAASSNANTNVSMMGETFKYVAPVAGSLGYSVEDMATAIGLMANSGIKGSQAGTALRSSLTRLVKPTDDVRAALKSLGLIQLADDTGEFTYDMVALNKEVVAVNKAQEAYNKTVQKYGEGSEKASAKALNLHEAQMKLDSAMLAQKTSALEYNAAIVDADGSMLSFEDTMKALRGAFSGLSEAEQANYAATIFGQEAMSGMLAIINSTEEDYTKLSDAVGGASDVMGGMGAAASMAETQLDNLGGKMTLFQSAFDGLKQAIYGNFEEPLSSAVETATEGISRITEGFNENGLQGALAALGSFATEKLSGLWDNLKLPPEVEGIAGFVGDLIGSFSADSARVISSIASAVSDFMEGFSNSGAAEAISGVATAVGDFVAAFAESVASVVSDLASGVSDLLDSFDAEGAGQIIGDIAAGIADFAAAVARVAGDIITRIADGIGKLIDAFNDSGAAESIGEFAKKIAEFVKPFTEKLADIIGKVGDKLGDLIDWIADFAASAISDIPGIIDSASGAFDKLVDAFDRIWEAAQPFIQWVEEVAAASFEALGAIIEGAWDIAVQAVQSFLDIIGDLADFVADVLTGDFEGAAEAIKRVWDDIVVFFSGIWESIKEVFSGVYDAFAEIGQNLVDGIKNGISGAWDSFTSWVSGKFNSFVDGVKDFFGIHSPSTVFSGIGENLVEGLAVGWGSEFDDLEKTVGKDMESLTGTAKIGFGDSAIGKSSAAGITSMLTAGAGASSAPIEINLVLDGDVAATALYDPLRRVAWQKGKAEAVYA